MYLIEWFKKMRKRRRDRIYEGPCEDGESKTTVNPNAPKNVQSVDLIYFSCKYSTLAFLEEDSNLKGGVYYLSASLEENGSVIYTVDCSEGIDVGSCRKEAGSIELLKEIDKILKRYDVASHNGYHHSVQALPDFYGVKIEADYSSGEQIYCYDNQDVFLPVEFLRELCNLFGVKNITPEN